MRASDFVQTEAARNASAERLIQTETTDAVNSGLVGSADKSGMALKEGLYSVDRSRVALTDQNLRGKARVSYGITDGSSADMAGLSATERIDAKIKQQAQAAAGKRVRVKRLYGSVQDEEMGLVDVTDSLRDEVKEIYKRRRLKGGAAAVAGSAVHSTLQDSELEGADDLYYKGKGAVNLARRAKRRLSGKDALRSKKKLGKLSEKGYEKKKAAETAADIQRRAQTRRYMHRSVQASAKASAARKGGLTALASQGGGGGIIAALGGGGTVAFIIIGVLLAVVLLTSFIAFQQQQNNGVGQLEGVAAEVATCLKGYGFSDEAIAAILGNMQQESGMNPGTDGDDGFGRGNTSIGLLQLTNSERTNYLNWCISNGKTWSSVSAQMEWTFSNEPGTERGYFANRWISTSYIQKTYYNQERGWEARFGTDFYKSGNEFKNATDLDLATYSWMACYERPGSSKSYSGNDVSRLYKRIEYAREFYQKLKASSSGSGQTYASSEGTARAIADQCYREPTTASGQCAKWVNNVYQHATGTRTSGNANDLYFTYCVSSNTADLKVGMIVASGPYSGHSGRYRSGSGGTTYYGHVGIYVGDGKVMHSTGGSVHTDSLEDWITKYTVKDSSGEIMTVKWGYPSWV